MSEPEVTWSLGLLAVLLLGLLALKRARRRTTDFQQSAIFKERLPGWVRQFEAITFCTFLCGSFMAVAWLFLRFGTSQHVGSHAMTGASAIYFALGVGLIALPVGMLSANLLSWLLPPVRAANTLAMEGLQVSFWSANRGLLLFGAASVPIGMALMSWTATRCPNRTPALWASRFLLAGTRPSWPQCNGRLSIPIGPTFGTKTPGPENSWSWKSRSSPMMGREA